jgi:hypothetical protein
VTHVPRNPIRVRLPCGLVLFPSFTNWLRFAKYLDSGVIIARAFIYLLPPLASSPHRVLETHGMLMYALYPAIVSPVIPILICSRNVALLPDTHYFPYVLHDLCVWNPCLPHWHSQAHEVWHLLYYGTLIMYLAPFPCRAIPRPSPFFLAWGLQ